MRISTAPNLSSVLFIMFSQSDLSFTLPCIENALPPNFLISDTTSSASSL